MNDRILTAYLNEFTDEFGYQSLSEPDAFELFLRLLRCIKIQSGTIRTR